MSQRRASLDALLASYCDPELEESSQRRSFDLIRSMVSLTPSGSDEPIIAAFASSTPINPPQSVPVDSSSDVAAPFQTFVPIQHLIGRMEALLTSSDDKTRHRATLLLAELLHTAMPINDSIQSSASLLSPAVLHLFIVFFLHRLGDYPSLLPSIHALMALIARFSACLDEKYCDVEDIVVLLHKTLFIPSLAQSIRQKYYAFIALLLRDPKVKTHLLSLPATTQSEFVGNIIAAGEGERDPRCLVSLLDIYTLIPRTTIAPSILQLHLRMLFDSATSYFPITFNPPSEDPYGITHALLVGKLLAALEAPSLLIYSIPYVLEQLESDTDFAKVQACGLLERVCENIDGMMQVVCLQTLAGAVYEVCCGGEGMKVDPDADPATNSQAAALNAIASICRSIDRHGQQRHPLYTAMYTKFTHTLLDKVCSAMQPTQALQSLYGQNNAALIIKLANVGYITRRAVVNAVMPVLIAKLAAAAGGVGGIYQKAGVLPSTATSTSTYTSTSTHYTVTIGIIVGVLEVLRGVVAAVPVLDLGLDETLQQWGGIVPVLLMCCGIPVGGDEVGGDGHDHAHGVQHEESEKAGGGCEASGGCCGGGHDHSHAHAHAHPAPTSAIPTTTIAFTSMGATPTPTQINPIPVKSALCLSVHAIIDVALRLQLDECHIETLLMRLVDMIGAGSGTGGTDSPSSMKQTSMTALALVAQCSTYRAQLGRLLRAMTEQLPSERAMVVLGVLGGSGGDADMLNAAIVALVGVVTSAGIGSTGMRALGCISDMLGGPSASAVAAALVKGESGGMAEQLVIKVVSQFASPDGTEDDVVDRLATVLCRVVGSVSADRAAPACESITVTLLQHLPTPNADAWDDGSRYGVALLVAVLRGVPIGGGLYGSLGGRVSEYAMGCAVPHTDTTHLCQLFLLLTNRLPIGPNLDALLAHITAPILSTSASGTPLYPLTLDLIITATQGLAMRGDTPYREMFVQHVLELLHSGSQMAATATEMVGRYVAWKVAQLTAAEPAGMVLVQKLFWRQRVFTTIIDRLLHTLEELKRGVYVPTAHTGTPHTGTSLTVTQTEDLKASLQVAVCGLSCAMPLPVLPSDIACISIETLTITALSLLPPTTQNPSTQTPPAHTSVDSRSMTTILNLLLSLPADHFIPHITTLAPLLLTISQLSRSKNRHLALQIIHVLAECPYPRLHPVRGMVLRGLARVCDDPKRAVRVLAARVRNAYTMLKG